MWPLRPTKIVVAPNAFKGTLSASEAATIIADELRSAFPDAALEIVPVADGGDGTLDALVAATDGRTVERNVTGPNGARVRAPFGLLGDGVTAVVELARASGLALLAPGANDPRTATTYGTGELIDAAIAAGASRIVVAIGGSATNDGGTGGLSALGARFLDDAGQPLPQGGAALTRLASIDTRRLAARLRSVAIDVASDVTNPLCGPNGASAVYGAQKGASPEVALELDAALAHFADVVAGNIEADLRDVPGAGAAGGTGFGFLALAGARLRPGAQLVLEVLDFGRRLAGASVVITGEGRLDRQTRSGKAPFAVAQAARAQAVRAAAIAGTIQCSPEELEQMGFSEAVALVDGATTTDDALTNPAPALRAAARRLAKRLPLM